MRIYGFPRSSASYRLRIACALKDIEVDSVLVDFRKDEQRSEDYLKVSPFGLVPTLVENDGYRLTQSLAIIRYLDRRYPSPRLIPEEAREEACVLELSLAVACDIHPINNLRVLKYLEHRLNANEKARKDWYANWIKLGFDGLEALIADKDGPYCAGRSLSLADVCLVPQMFNARRYDVDLSPYPRLVEIDERLRNLPAFKKAAA